MEKTKARNSDVELLRALFPVTFEQYWFVTAYMILYAFTPFLNKFLNDATRREHLAFAAALVFIFSVLKTASRRSLYGNALTELLMFYSIGAYFRRFPDNFFSKKHNNTKVFALAGVFLCASVAVLDVLSGKNAVFGRLSTCFFSRLSIVALLFAMSLFSLFVNIKPFNSRPINQIAACTFGVYLIHDNSIMRNLLWIKIFKNADYAVSEYLILHLIVTVAAVYTCCTVIEFIRKTVFKWFARRTDAHVDAFQKKLEDKISVFYGRKVEAAACGTNEKLR